jgi:hypothetical protein
MFLLISEPIDFTTLSGWWSLAQNVGPGATLATVFGLWWMSKELSKRDDIIGKKDADLKAEVTYSKDLTAKQLTVISELTTLIHGIDRRDIDSVGAVDRNTDKILSAISDLKGAVIQHALGTTQKREAA